jgi:hypothetical protein
MYHMMAERQIVVSLCDDSFYVCKKKRVVTHLAGLLQPFPIPTRAWSDISMDFTEGLPFSHNYYMILVVVDRLTKCGRFLSLSHPYTTYKLAQLFLANVLKLHGMPKTIVSYRDPIFTSTF